ncbi:MAG: response regulator [Chloroflexi bacterium]|nr:response regulator [Chloroflexota bacterium]
MAQLMVVVRPGDERRDLVLALKEKGHLVHEADDGGSALELIRVLRPTVVIMNIDLANLDGLSVLKELRRSSTTKKLPVVLLGTSERTAVRTSAIQLGAIDYLVKPFSTDDVCLRVSWALKASSTIPAVPWDLTDMDLSTFLADTPVAVEIIPETAPVAETSYEMMASSADSLPGAAISMMTPERGGEVETADGVVRVEVPAGSVRLPLSLGAARVNGQEAPLEESVRIRMGRRVADLTFIDQSGAPVGGPRLDRPVKISIKYDERDIAELGSVDSLSLERFQKATGDWKSMQSSVDLKSQRAVTWQKDFSAGRKPYGGSILVAKAAGPELNLLVDAVEGAGFRAIVESDGLAVTNRALEERPDVAVVDLGLPRLDGIQILRQIKGNSITRPTSVILLAENDERNLQSSLMTMGVRDIIFKPWLPGDIQRRVQRAYQSSRASKLQQQRAFDRVKARQERRASQRPGRVRRAS